MHLAPEDAGHRSNQPPREAEQSFTHVVTDMVATRKITLDSSLELEPKWQWMTCMVWYDVRVHLHHAVMIARASMRDEGGGEPSHYLLHL